MNSGNKTEAINTLVVPVVTYGFGIINWSMREIQRIDTKTRKLLTSERMHHPKADVERLYQPRNDGGRGLMKIETSYKMAVVGLVEYLETTEDQLLIPAWQYEKEKNSKSLLQEKEKIGNEMQINRAVEREDQARNQRIRELKREVKDKIMKRDAKTWEEKALHGKYVKRIQEADLK